MVGTTTIKRNGVFIIFPTKENAPIKEKIPSPSIHPVLKPQVKQRVMRPEQHRHIIRKTPQGNVKKCWRCGDLVWRSDVNYCWDCYKYENFESK